MNKKIFIGGVIMLSLVFVGVGCAKKQSNDSNTNQQANNTNEQRKQMKDIFSEEKFNKLDISSLSLGKNVLVMGQENPDGMVIADNVIVASSSTDPMEIMRSMMPVGGFASGTPEGEMPTGENDAQREEMRAKFENMSEEDREAMRQEMESRRGEMGAGGPPEGGMGGGPMGENDSNNSSDSNSKKTGSVKMARITGEIMEISDNSFTVKLKDGGSKIIYFSGDTGFWEVKDVINGASTTSTTPDTTQESQ